MARHSPRRARSDPRPPRPGRGGPRRAALPLVAVSLLAAGCGTSDEEFRKQELRPLEQRVEEQRGQIAATLKVVQLRNRRHARALRKQIDTLAATYRRIAALDAPDDEAREQLQRYDRASAGLIAQLRRFADALAAGDRRALNRIGQQAQEAAGATHRAQQALKEELSS